MWEISPCVDRGRIECNCSTWCVIHDVRYFVCDAFEVKGVTPAKTCGVCLESATDDFCIYCHYFHKFSSTTGGIKILGILQMRIKLYNMQTKPFNYIFKDYLKFLIILFNYLNNNIIFA